MATDWRDHISSDGGVMAGKPETRGTRITLDLVLKVLAAGWSNRSLTREYPGVTGAGIRECQACAAERIADDRLYPLAG